MSFISNIVGGILGANAAGNASKVEQQGAQAAQQVSQQNQTSANQAQQTALGNITTAEQPYQTVGSTAAGGLNKLLSTGFTAPTLAEAEATPGYEFNLQTGTDALTKQAAATGNLMSGTTGTALEEFGQGLAQNTYQQAYQNALSSYMANFNTLAGGANIGQGSTNTLAGANLNTAGNTANIDLTAAQQQMQQLNNAAAARAQGILGTAAGYGEMASGIAQAVPSVAGMLGGDNAANFFSGVQS